MKGGEIMKGIHYLAMTLLWIGGINLGLIGLFNYNLIAIVGSGLEKLVYIFVGLAAAYSIVTHRQDCKICSGK